jgi:heterodisulfide reductase subunit C
MDTGLLSNIIFLIFLVAGSWLFARNVRRITRNIRLGREVNRSDQPEKRWMVMAAVSLGQSKMVTRPVAAFFHILIYAGFIIINIEVLEILIDGIFGTHRVFAFLGGFYNFLIASFEYLAIAVLLACFVFLARRNILKLKRFWQREMTAWPRTDANLILITEILLMTAFLTMNASDSMLQSRGVDHYTVAGSFPVSNLLHPLLAGMSNEGLILLERICWWFHILGILAFLNYVPYSKHFHIFLAFPNTWYSNLQPKGKFNNMTAVTATVKEMMGIPVENAPDPATPPQRFGAKDVRDLTWKQLMDAYSCTECGRCTAACPANITGKLLSPRKIMMDTRDRLEEVGKNIDTNGPEHDDGKSLLFNYIMPEELWACTTCNACVQACPVNIDPLSIIMDMRQYLVMEESNAPAELNGMFSKIENNGAPWQFSPADRLNWTES